MALETASFVANLVTTNPDGSDARSTADDHLRLIKATLVRTFPKLDGAVSLSAAQVMFSNDLSASVQLQLNQLRDGSATANNAVNSRYANSASLALTANSASYAALAGTAALATLALTANSASYAVLAGTSTLALTANSASYAALAGTAQLAVTANSASYATLAGTAASATTVAGRAGSAAVSTGAETVAFRSTDGYIFSVYFNQSSGGDENISVGQVFAETAGDGYLRKVNMARLGAYLEARNITNKTGIAKTLSTSSPSGGSNGDIWYKYVFLLGLLSFGAEAAKGLLA